MNGQINLEKIANSELRPYLYPGPLITDLLSNAGGSSEEHRRLGGYEIARRIAKQNTRDEAIQSLDDAGLRGRAGGGYPTAHKWWLVSQSESEEKYFICNANAGQAGSFKERFLLSANPRQIIEAVMTGALVVGASLAFIALPPHLSAEARLLEEAIQEARDQGYLGSNIFDTSRRLDVFVYKSLGGYIIGEETALMELMEGKVGRPRTKPPLPTARGLFGMPTVVNNLETILNAYYILRVGAEQYRQAGQTHAPGTLIFSLSGHVKRPGLYELPLGTTLRELIFEHGQGMADGRALKAIFPGGVSSAVLGPESLDVGLDFDSMREVDSDLGSGSVIVVAEQTCMAHVATQLAEFFYFGSCGKCQPCKDGTQRTGVMLHNLQRLDEKSIDRSGKILPQSLRKRTLNVLNNPVAGVSYTDTTEGLDKIRYLCEFYKYRGDCHHSTEAANSIQGLLKRFMKEFEEHTLSAECHHEGLVAV
ncbi:MAG TPA: NADH-ubiquinone oxidoreductase-F iron-sulfur binding region domain-containing protein [Pyrinomonadaceae bacterium]|nr:NADH-ubiquinone oxidoreductase-F iron-sulfur binding region domain-containing protein [Pyrinomonadaceae bacterium]